MEAYLTLEKRQECVKMDSELIEDIYRQYYKNVYNYIGFRINNHFDTEELANLVFEKAMRSWGSYNPTRPIEAWLIGIAKNTTTDYLRSRTRRRFVPWDNIVEMVCACRQPEQVVLLMSRTKP